VANGSAISEKDSSCGNRPEAVATAAPSLTTLNMQVLSERVRDHLSPEARGRLQIAVYDETPCPWR
jgi:hypothetical protein